MILTGLILTTGIAGGMLGHDAPATHAQAGHATFKQEVNIWVSKDVAPSDKIRLNINTRNAPGVYVDAYAIDGDSWLRQLGNSKVPEPRTSGRPIKQWTLSVASAGQKPNPNQADTYYSRQVNLPPMPPGVYKIEVKGGGGHAWAVVNVTNLAVIVKRSPHHALVWVTDFKSGRVMPDTKVTFYSRNGSAIDRAVTKSDGAVQVTLRPGDETLVVRHGSDMAGVPSGAPDPDGQLRAHFQTDRPIYRPGQTIQFKASLRRTLGRGYSVVGNQPCLVQLRDPKDNPVDEVRLTSTAMGTVAGQFELPEEGMLGAYSLVLSQGKDSAYQTVTVAEYRKPEYKVEVSADQKRYLSGEDITFVVDSQYYFGAPVPQAEVKYQVRRNPMYFWGMEEEDRWFYSGDGNLYARDTYNANPFVAEDTVYTDANGKAVIKIKTDPKIGDSSYSLTCTVTDASRRQVEGGGSVPVYGAAIRLGLSTRLVYASLGSVVPVDVRLVDLDGKPIGGKVAIEVHRQEYDEKKQEWKDIVDTSTSATVPASGKLTVTLPARREGEMRITATAPDNTGRHASAELSLYVSGNFEKPPKEKEQPKVGIMLDRRVYEVDSVAKALITTNNPNRPLLLTLEGGDVWDYKVITDPKRSQTWTIPTAVRLSPNAYVGVVQWVKGQAISGNAMLPVPDRTKMLNVTATPDKTDYRPGDKAVYTIHTVDGHGKPTPAEVVLAVIDEAIYALSPDNTADMYGMFWGQRGNLVTMHMSAPEELSGGAYQRAESIAPLRQRFEDTAYWNPIVDTDATGTATVSFEMPGNLTTWRATARGMTADTAVGTGVSKVVANRPVMLRLATPRQIVQGDRVTLIGTIDNRSDSEHAFSVSLDAGGIGLEGDATQRITVPAKTQSKVQWVLDAHDMPSDGKATLTGRISATDNPSADYGDALRVTVPVVPNGLPVRQVLGGTVAQQASIDLEMPADRIEPASVVSLTVRAGLRPAMQEASDEVLRNPRYGSPGSANQLRVAAATGLSSQAKQVKESLALLSRTSRPDGWAWWERGQTDPIITAAVASALGEAKESGIRVFDSLILAARASTVYRFNQTNLWDHRALLAAAAVQSGEPKGYDMVQEVLKNGKNLSPYGRLRLAGALITRSEPKQAAAILAEIVPLVSEGSSSSYLPAGEGIGWSASDVETTAELLHVLVRLNQNRDLQRRLAMWLTSPDQEWHSLDEDAALSRSLALYLKNHLEPDRLGDVQVSVNGKLVETTPSKFAQAVTASIPRSALQTGRNVVEVHRSGGGEAFYSLEARVYRPMPNETTEGVRVLRRFEVKNAGGTWVELNRDVHPGEPVRCTMVAWGDSIRDSVRVVEPLPSGFEYIEGESSDWGYQEIRDGAVVHYLTNTGAPQTFEYYIRAEAEGSLTALPATAEYLRRPAMRGQTNALRVRVVDTASPPLREGQGG